MLSLGEQITALSICASDNEALNFSFGSREFTMRDIGQRFLAFLFIDSAVHVKRKPNARHSRFSLSGGPEPRMSTPRSNPIAGDLLHVNTILLEGKRSSECDECEVVTFHVEFLEGSKRERSSKFEHSIAEKRVCERRKVVKVQHSGCRLSHNVDSSLKNTGYMIIEGFQDKPELKIDDASHTGLLWGINRVPSNQLPIISLQPALLGTEKLSVTFEFLMRKKRTGVTSIPLRKHYHILSPNWVKSSRRMFYVRYEYPVGRVSSFVTAENLLDHGRKEKATLENTSHFYRRLATVVMIEEEARICSHSHNYHACTRLQSRILITYSEYKKESRKGINAMPSTSSLLGRTKNYLGKMS
ncbi:uncharacterized protein BDR25DRAFT_353699 [Lindgomyces ingoldianus]|uniref:Uncharacterized protein n=1 Tax=Lindgomyces ingoldianus TaxID=673940 RepID=A0ACB6QZF7_9PLEO|nr:uncharacterized protein BDR25DRAFT_353699 [Lindgomyces ingoldianus]KAF2471925.1 hypothetical protein BDR25DRAFT_353699 [Lindgomyces ingoldianus]